MPAFTTPGAWRDGVRQIEDLGFDTISISDHFTRGWVMDPLAAMLAVSETTSSIRVLSLVLGNDYRHPAMVHKAIATIDALSGGRVELGLGAGWLESDYAAAGMHLDLPAVRIDRLEESVAIIKGLFGDTPVTYHGRHYHVTDLEGLPKPTQSPRPPMLLGGGGRRILELSGREADIVGIHCRLPDGEVTRAAAADLGPARVAEKVGWARAAARESGRDSDALELQFTVYLCRVSGSPGSTSENQSSFARLLAADPALLEGSPAVLIGDVEECVDLLLERREQFGLSYINLGPDVEAVAPIVARLKGR
ncbi:MAG: TIGR03621 family F420-dependent LLM class oxidoreductase [Chloroflexi bacterium]|nr:TIGR03621 family F420-dependent LLM class oxidoreductase [Chloroflexota bacterium]